MFKIVVTPPDASSGLGASAEESLREEAEAAEELRAMGVSERIIEMSRQTNRQRMAPPMSIAPTPRPTAIENVTSVPVPSIDHQLPHGVRPGIMSPSPLAAFQQLSIQEMNHNGNVPTNHQPTLTNSHPSDEPMMDDGESPAAANNQKFNISITAPLGRDHTPHSTLSTQHSSQSRLARPPTVGPSPALLLAPKASVAPALSGSRIPCTLFPRTHTDSQGYLLPPISNPDLGPSLARADSFWIGEEEERSLRGETNLEEHWETHQQQQQLIHEQAAAAAAYHVNDIEAAINSGAYATADLMDVERSNGGNNIAQPSTSPPPLQQQHQPRLDLSASKTKSVYASALVPRNDMSPSSSLSRRLRAVGLGEPEWDTVLDATAIVAHHHLQQDNINTTNAPQGRYSADSDSMPRVSMRHSSRPFIVSSTTTGTPTTTQSPTTAATITTTTATPFGADFNHKRKHHQHRHHAYNKHVRVVAGEPKTASAPPTTNPSDMLSSPPVMMLSPSALNLPTTVHEPDSPTLMISESESDEDDIQSDPNYDTRSPVIKPTTMPSLLLHHQPIPDMSPIPSTPASAPIEMGD